MKQTKPYIIYTSYLVLSIAAIFLAPFTHQMLDGIFVLDTQVNHIFSLVFSASPLGVALRLIISLALLPVLIIAIPAFLYRLITHKTLPYLIPIIWLLWIITVLSRLLVPQGL